MNNRILAPLLACVALSSGCMTANRLNNLRIGMPKDQVISLLGTPDSTSAQANIEYLTYYLYNESGSSYGRDQPYSVRLVEGKVESFGRFAQLFDIYNRPIPGGPPNPYSIPAPVQSKPDIAGQLQRLKTLKDQGVLSDAEFQKAKDKLLSDEK